MSDPQAQALAQAVNVVVQYAPLVAQAMANPAEPVQGMPADQLLQMYAQQVQALGPAMLGEVYSSLPADQRKSVADVLQTNTMAQALGYGQVDDPALAQLYQTMGNDRFTDPTAHNRMTQAYGDMVNQLDRDTYDKLQGGHISYEEAALLLHMQQQENVVGHAPAGHDVEELPDHVGDAEGRRRPTKPLAITAGDLADLVHIDGVHIDPDGGDVDVSFDVGGGDFGGF